MGQKQRAIGEQSESLMWWGQGVVSEDRLEQRMAALERVFSMAASQDTPGQVAAEYTCNLTLEPFREPVITPAGLSYEGTVLTEHLERVGAWWPMLALSLDLEVQWAGAVWPSCRSCGTR